MLRYGKMSSKITKPGINFNYAFAENSKATKPPNDPQHPVRPQSKSELTSSSPLPAKMKTPQVKFKWLLHPFTAKNARIL